MSQAAELADALAGEPIEVVGRLVDSSNNALLVEVGQQRLVYKPAAGERPLWDFPEHTLGKREVAAYELSRMLGWDLVPPTVWSENGPYGPGMFQQWVYGGIATDHVNLFAPQGFPSGWHAILQAENGEGNAVVLGHSDAEILRRMTVFDMLANNADRKAGHILTGSFTESADAEEHAGIYGIDHGVCFHSEAKLRTVLWGFGGTPIPDVLCQAVATLHDQLLIVPNTLTALLDQEELAALISRTEDILATKTFTEPDPERMVVPWPVF